MTLESWPLTHPNSPDNKLQHLVSEQCWETARLHNEITKKILETNPKLLIQLYEHEGTDFNVCIESRYDSAPDPERYNTWIREVSAKTKYYACKQITRKTTQRNWDPSTTFDQNQTKTIWQGDTMTNLSISSRIVPRISETPHGNQAIYSPNRDPTVGQHVWASSRWRHRKKLLRHLILAPALTIDENVQCFSDIVLLAIEKEDELKTVTNIAERAAFRGERGAAPRGRFKQQRGARIFLARAGQQRDNYKGSYDE